MLAIAIEYAVGSAGDGATHDSSKNYVSGGVDPLEKGPVTIGEHTAIGTMCVIRHGVTIGDHCVIGAHSFVNRDVPPCSIAAGVPARVIGRVVLKEDGSVVFEYDKTNV